MMSRPKLPALPCLLLLAAAAVRVAPAAADARPIAIVIHGGAGVIEPARSGC